MSRLLTLDQVRTIGLAAYHAKQLSAQGPTPACRYRDASGRPCIIGAAMTDEEAAHIPNDMPVGAFHKEDTRVYTQGDERADLICLQALHDSWAKAAAGDPELAYDLIIDRVPSSCLPEGLNKQSGPEVYEAALLKALSE